MKRAAFSFIAIITGFFSQASAIENDNQFTLSSSAFSNNGDIPFTFACSPRGQNISPDLSWTNPPLGTESFALTVLDPDAPNGTVIHWLVYNIPKSETRLTNSFPRDEKNSRGIMQGLNTHNHIGYDGPCPPSGKHHYIFTIFALNTDLALLQPGLSYKDLSNAMKGHVIGQAQLVGTFAY